MASIERTAYPRLKNNISQKELKEKYTLLLNEINHAYSVVKGKTFVISYLVLLKCFQNIGYFPPIDEIPNIIIKYINQQIDIEHHSNAIEYKSKTTLYSHHKSIRMYLNIKQYDSKAKDMIKEAIYKNTYIMKNPADLINSSIDILIKNNYELPAYAYLDKITLGIRTRIHNEIFESVLKSLTIEQKKILDLLLDTNIENNFSDLKYLKDPVKKPSFNNMKELITKLNWLESKGNFENIINDVPYSKLKHFYDEVTSLDASEIKKHSDPKRYTMLISFLHISKARLRDNLVDMFLKCINKINNKGKEELKIIRGKLQSKAENIVSAFAEVLNKANEVESDEDFGKNVRNLINNYGGHDTLYDDCASISSYNGNNHHVLLQKFFSKQRFNIFKLLEILDLNSTTEDQSLIDALKFITDHYKTKSKRKIKPMETIKVNLDLSFATDLWEKTVIVKKDGDTYVNRGHLESCIFSCLATELKTGDVYVKGSERYSDYREQLVDWEECVKEIPEYCKSLGLKDDADSFIDQLKESLTKTAEEVDKLYPGNKSLVIDSNGIPTLKKYSSEKESIRVKELEEKLSQNMPERNILEILCNTQHWTNWTRHYSPVSGSDTKIENAIEKYIILTFCYGCNLGPVQTSKHIKRLITPHVLSYLNSRHVTLEKLDSTLQDIINKYRTLEMPSLWGTGKLSAADGTMLDLYSNNLFSEYHIRYGGNGGILFHLISDTYIALLGTFIPCGAWEAIYLLDLFIKNKSDIQPDTVHGDTQEQSGTVFALSHLLGVKLMPRIRNWKDLTFFRPDKDIKYNHIDSLFKDTIDWDLIKTHWKDIFQVVISIKEGKILPSTLLKKLNNKSKKNRLFHAFRELGMAVRTIFLLRYIIDSALQKQITATANKMEAYNGFIKWILFGAEGTITENDPIEQEKRIKYAEVVANAIILHNVVDMTNTIRKLINDGYEISQEDIAALSPYITKHIKRFGDYHININFIPAPIQGEILSMLKKMQLAVS